MTFWRLSYHIVWGTKNKSPWITPEIEPRLFAYLIRKAKELEVTVYAVNAYLDHIHLVVSIPPKRSISEVVKNLKGASSHDLNRSAGFDGEFTWQRGYGVLSVGERHKQQAITYVNQQKAHHDQRTAHPWLERSSDVEDASDEIGLSVDWVPGVIREPRESYQVNVDEFPF